MAEVNNTPTTKVARRGITTARGTQRLKFSHTDAKPNGLFIAHLESVDVSMIKIGEESTGLPSFNGMEIPRLRFLFTSNEADEAKRKYITLSFTPAESNAETIPGGKSEWKVTNIFDWVQHLFKVFILKGREFTEEEADLLSLPFVDFDEAGQYVPVDAETVVAGWTQLFNNIENAFNRGKDGKSYYKTADNKNIPVWIKLIRYNKTKKSGWTALQNGELVFPTFVGEGCVEIVKPNEMPAIKLNPITECITPKDIESKKKAQAPNVPAGVMPSVGAVNLGSEMLGGMPDFGASMIDEDMPDFGVM